MLLQRVAKHLRDQNWLAVAIDFLIVVFGVLLANQITNWNEARQDRIRASVFSESLKRELRAELGYANALIAYNRSTLSAGRLAYASLSGMQETDDETLLINAYRASQYNWYERRRAAFDQIVSSGSLSLISDPALLDTAVGVYNTQIFGLMLEEGQNSKFRELFRMNVEPAMQDELARNCGDIADVDQGFAVGLITIDYDCSLDASAEEISAAAQALRSDPLIVRSLGSRNVQTQGRISDLEGILETLGLNALFPEDTAP
ncbi:MAG TPA: DUF6090 family protein [Hyphomonas sp.]|nr:DUF6090 family protein [Hyphomonas sp.]HRX73469.1 DUF6090 family protein [Hyphomonas sp.]